jgi:hypothetical protein
MEMGQVDLGVEVFCDHASEGSGACNGLDSYGDDIEKVLPGLFGSDGFKKGFQVYFLLLAQSYRKCMGNANRSYIGELKFLQNLPNWKYGPSGSDYF